MSKKTILIISLSEKKDRLDGERDARKKILSQEKSSDEKEGLCIEFYYPDPSDPGKINPILKKRKPQIVVFDSCCHNTIHHYHKVIRGKVKDVIFYHKYTSGVLDDKIRENLILINSLTDIKKVATN